MSAAEVEQRVRKTIARLATGEVDVAEECDRFWAASRDGEHGFLFRLAEELELSELLRQSPLGMIGAIWSLVSEIEQASLAIPGEASIETLFRFALLPRHSSLTRVRGMVDRPRYFASRLALNQPRSALLAAMARHEAEEPFLPFLFLLVQELVVQGFHEPNALLERLHHRMRELGHPLGWLPLRLSGLESVRADPRKTRSVHQYKVYDSRLSFPWGPHLASPSAGPAGGAEPPPPTPGAIRNWEVTKGDDLLHVAAAVANWQAESNGRFEARVFACQPPLAAGPLARAHVLRLHPVTALDLPGGPQALHLEPIRPEQALAVLFKAAANGGELNEGAFGAYGRLYAWRSLAGLAGARDGASIEEVEEVARAASWTFFSARSRWFHGLGEELGLIAVRPDGGSLALLAATDSD